MRKLLDLNASRSNASFQNQGCVNMEDMVLIAICAALANIGVVALGIAAWLMNNDLRKIKKTLNMG